MKIIPSLRLLSSSSTIVRSPLSFHSFRAASHSALSMNIQEFQNVKDMISKPHPNNNIPIQIIEKIGTNLHLKSDHPLGIIKEK